MPRTSHLLTAALVATAWPAHAQTFGPDFAPYYSFTDLGNDPAIPSPYGGVQFPAGDTDRLLLGGAANSSAGVIMEVAITRDPTTNRISGFSGTPTWWADAPYVDGGMDYAPNGTLFFTEYPVHKLAQLKPGSTTPDREDDLTPYGITSSVGACLFVPPGFPGAGSLKIVSFNTGDWYDADIVPDGSGTYDLTGVTLEAAALPGGPEGMVYIAAGNPGFTADSILLSEWSAGNVAAYEVDADGDPIPSTRRDFLIGLTGAEGALIDPITGDFVFSTFGGGDRVLVVHGFTAPQVYCDAKLNSAGCLPSIGYSGLPTLSGADDFHILATDVTNNTWGAVLWSLSPDNLPAFGGTLCVASPVFLWPPMHSGGTPGGLATDCSGSYSLHFGQALMTGLGLGAGDSVYTQVMHRDPGFGAPNAIGLTQGLRFTIAP